MRDHSGRSVWNTRPIWHNLHPMGWVVVSLALISACGRLSYAPQPLHIVSPQAGEAYLGGSEVEVRWEYAAHPVTVALSLDGGETFEEVASAEPQVGSVAFTLPPADTANARIRVDAIVDQATTGDFIIDSTPPVITNLALDHAPIVATGFARLLTEVDDLSGPAQARAAESDTLAGATWSSYESPLPYRTSTTGDLRIYVQVMDRVGLISEPSDIALTIDRATPPAIRFLGPPRRTPLVAGGSVALELHVYDEEGPLPSDSVDIEYTADNGSTWNAIATGIGVNFESADPDVPNLVYSFGPVPAELEGVGVTFRAFARDVAGNRAGAISHLVGLASVARIAGGAFDFNEVTAQRTFINGNNSWTPRWWGAVLIRDPFTNRIFFQDANQGVRTIDGTTGIVDSAAFAGETRIRSVSRDDFGNVYGCHEGGIFRWVEGSRSWEMYAEEPCDRVMAWKQERDQLYYFRERKLYRYDPQNGSRWVAFDGTLTSPVRKGGDGGTCYAFHPRDPRTGCAPTHTYLPAVDGSGRLWMFDFCYLNNENPDCRSRVIVFDPSKNTVSIDDDSDGPPRAHGLLYRSSNDSFLGANQAVYDEDPFTGELYGLDYQRRLNRYPASMTFEEDCLEGNYGCSPGYGSPSVEPLEHLAGMDPDFGDGGEPTEAHLVFPTHPMVGHPLGPHRDRIFVPSGLGCCANWAYGLRWFEADGGSAIASYTGARIAFSRGALPQLPDHGFLAVQTQFWPVVTPGGEEQRLVQAERGECMTSPTHGAPASEANWPWRVYWLANYAPLFHSDQYVYASGFRSTGPPTPDSGGHCVGVDDVQIVRFAFDRGTEAAGVIEHVAGARGALPDAPAVASGELARDFAFTGRIRVRENLNAGANGNLFVLDARRVRVIDRQGADPARWRIYDVALIPGEDAITSWALGAGVDARGTRGSLYYASGKKLHRYRLGTNQPTNLEIDVVEELSFAGLERIDIRGVDVLSDGRVVFSDNRYQGAVYLLMN